jgi:hypothetical protein
LFNRGNAVVLGVTRLIIGTADGLFAVCCALVKTGRSRHNKKNSPGKVLSLMRVVLIG